MAYDPQYYKQYYEQRKAEILAARGEKYRNDPAYRDAIIRRARVSSVMRVLTNQKQKEAARVIHAGRPERVFYVAYMESIVNRDRCVIDGWKRLGILPAALYYDKRGRGMYSESQVKYIAKALSRLDNGKLSMTYADLKTLFHVTWKETFSEKNLTIRIREVLHGKYSGYTEETKTRKVRPSKGNDRASL